MARRDNGEDFKNTYILNVSLTKEGIIHEFCDTYTHHQNRVHGGISHIDQDA
jgi:hypothetical protein